MFSTPSLSLVFVSKKVHPLHFTDCHNMSVRTCLREDWVPRCLQGFPRAAPPWSGLCAENWESLASLEKIWGTKNLTCKNLSRALNLWHFIKMLPVKSEPIFWLSRSYKTESFPKRNHLTSGRLHHRFFPALWMNPPFCPTNTTHCKCQVSPGGEEAASLRMPQPPQGEGHSTGQCSLKGWLSINANIRHQNKPKQTQTCFQQLEVTVKADAIKRHWVNRHKHAHTKASQSSKPALKLRIQG